MPLIKLINLNKIYNLSEKLSFKALLEVNLEIDKGEFVAIVGPSGSGKSTLMNIIGLLDQPTSGSYELDGHDVAKLNEDTLAEIRNKKIGFVFQSFNLLSRTTVLDNVSLPLIYSGIKEKQRHERALVVLKEVGLEDKIQSFSNQLSGGQQQRVAIARALVTNPDVILADEPTGNLDSKNGAEIISLFHQLNQNGRTIVLITHDHVIAKNAKRVIKVRDGRIVL